MTGKIVTLGDGRSVRMGRRRPPPGRPKLHLKNYLLKPELPAPPPSVDYMTKAAPALAQTYLNSVLGDCFEAWAAHAIGIWTANGAGEPMIFPDQQVQAAYSAWGGYVAGNAASDQGTVEQDGLTLWQSNGFSPGTANAHKIAGWVAIDGTNPVLTRTAINLFENLTFGVELPQAWLDANPEEGFVWDVAGNPDADNGHAFGSAAYEPGMLKIATWGITGWMTDAAVTRYTASSAQGELYAVLSPEVIVRGTQKAPNSVDWTALLSDLTLLPDM